MSELGNNIRRIAKTAELKRKIDELQNLLVGQGDKLSIKAHVSTAYTNSTAGGGGGGNPRLDPDVDAAAGVGAGGAEASNGYTGSMDNLFNNQPEVGAQLEALDGFFDCNSGEEAKINLDGRYDPEVIEGIPNNGTWSGEATADPRLADFTAGTRYRVGGTWALSPYNAFAVWISEGAFAATAEITSVTTTEGCYKPTPASNEACVAITSDACDIGVDTSCPADLSGEPDYTWESDAVHNLAFDGAQFGTSAQENADDKFNKWDNNPSKMSGCDSVGNQVVLTPTGDGGISIDYSDGKHIEQKDGFITAVSGY